MEIMMAAGLFAQPIGLAIGGALVLLSTLAIYRLVPRATTIRPLRLGGGYVGAIFVCGFYCAATVYVSPEEALRIWKVPSEAYWSVLGKEFLAFFIVLCYVAVVGIALVGAPVIFVLNSLQRANVPWIAVASLVISLVVAILLESLAPSNKGLPQTFLFVTGVHLLLTVGFCIGAGLPWRLRTVSA